MDMIIFFCKMTFKGVFPVPKFSWIVVSLCSGPTHATSNPEWICTYDAIDDGDGELVLKSYRTTDVYVIDKQFHTIPIQLVCGRDSEDTSK